MKDARAPPTSVFIACEMSRGERPRYVGPHLCDLTSSASLILYLRPNISTWMNNDLLDGFPKRRLRVKRNKICTSNETIFAIIEGGGFHMEIPGEICHNSNSISYHVSIHPSLKEI